MHLSLKAARTIVARACAHAVTPEASEFLRRNRHLGNMLRRAVEVDLEIFLIQAVRCRAVADDDSQ